MKKVVRLTENELTKLIGKVVNETKNTRRRKINEMENFVNPEAMQKADAIYTIIGTIIGLLGISGYDYLKSLAQELMAQGKEKKAQKIMDFVEKNQPQDGGEMDGDSMDDEDIETMAESRRRNFRKIYR